MFHKQEANGMTQGHDELLADELGKLGQLGAAIGNRLSGHSSQDKAAASGGSLGARLTAQFLPTETRIERIGLPMPPERALRLGHAVLSKLGSLQPEAAEAAPYPMLKAVVKSGFLNMNPAIVYFEILDGDDQRCEVTLTAAAKEGLIKQQSAAKAIARVLDGLRGLSDRAP